VTCYLYGFAPGTTSVPDVRGVAGLPVRVVATDDLGLLVSDLDDDLVLDESEAPHHLDALLAVLDRGPVLPVAFGTLAPDEPSLIADVSAQAPALRRELERLAEVVEIDVTAVDDEASAVAAVVAGAPDRFRPGGDPLVLGERVAAAVMQHRGRVADDIVLRLRELSVEDTARKYASNPEEPFLQWAFLVPREAVGKFDDAVAELTQRTPGLVVQSVGPLPPFSFVSTGAVGAESSSAVQQGAAPAPEGSDPFRSGKWGW